MLRFFKSPALLAFLGFSALYAVSFAFIFGGAWSFDVAAVQPDGGNFFAVDFAARMRHDLFGGLSTFIPFDVVGLFSSPYLWQELRYALSAYLAALAVVYYLRGRGLSHLAAYSGGGAYGLMGYAFTLFSAGHWGWFQFLMYGPFAFGLVDRALRRGAAHHWILLGASLAWAAARQPDMWLIFTALTFAYGVWGIIREFTCRCSFSRIRRVLVGILLTMATALVIGLPSFVGALTGSLDERDRQIAIAGQGAGSNAAASAAERWRFCTGWSLPPEAVAEFFLPRIFGDTSDVNIIELRRRHGWREAKPYTGRLGMPMTEMAFGQPAAKWMPYRQHSLYFGMLTVVFALLGISSLMWLKKPVSSPGAEEPALSNRGEIIFWALAAGIALLCAFGCFTPFYRLVYALPFGSYLRAPVKFVHVVEFAFAVLAGFGVAALHERFKCFKAVFWGLLALSVINVMDLARVDALYLGPLDVSFHRAANDAASDMIKAGGGSVAVLVPPQEGGGVFGESFMAHGAKLADLNAARGNIDKSGAAFLFAGAAQIAKMPELGEKLKSGALELTGTYTVSPQKGIVRSAQNRAQAALLRVCAVTRQTATTNLPPLWKRLLNYVSLFSTLIILAMLVYRALHDER